MNRTHVSKDLVLKVSQGDTRAFKEFYDVFCDCVYQFACYYIKAEVIREEIVSDVFISLWHNREKLTEIDNFEAYLYIVTRNKAYNHFEKEAVIPEIQSRLPLELSMDSNDPEKMLLNKELEIVLNSCIDNLSKKCRIIFLMSRKQNLKYHEIAEILSISEKTVHAQMVIALRKLNEGFKKYLGISEKKLQNF